MALPALSQFLTRFPSHSLSTPFSTVLQSLEQVQTGRVSHIIVVDTHQRPVGAIPVLQLWGLSQQAVGDRPRVPSASHHEPSQHQPIINVSLASFQDLMQPIVQVMANQTLADLWGTIRWTEQCPLVVVDSQMQYAGVVNPEDVLNWLSTHLSPDLRNALEGQETFSQSRLSAKPTATLERPWLIELSHALKTPMTSLLGLSTLLLDKRVGPLNERQTRYVSLIRQSVRRLIRTINQLLDWMRLESEQMPIHPQVLNVRTWSAELLPSFLTEFPDLATSEAVQRHFQVVIDPQIQQIMADGLRLKQSLHYFMEYLLLAGLPPQELTVCLWGNWIGFTLQFQGNASSLSVLKRGLKVRSLSQTSTDEHNLLDMLGVVLACGLIEAHGGEINYLMSPHFGNQITLLLPKTPLETTFTSEDSEQCLHQENPRTSLKHAHQTSALVLLVCNQTTVMEQVYGSLLNQPYQLIIAHTSEDAQAKYARLEPDLLMIDTGSMDGAVPSVLANLGSLDHKSIVVIGNDQAAVPTHLDTMISPDRLAEELLPLLNQLQEATLTDSPLPPFQRHLTLLLLRPQPALIANSVATDPLQSFYGWLQHFRCRLLQVDDLAQAIILSRVWQPDAIIIDAALPVSEAYLKELAQQPELAMRPLVTLTSRATELAYLVPGLWVVACTEAMALRPRQGAMTLIQILATVTGMAQFHPDWGSIE
jgi:signal transduction histidine kinase